MPPLETRPTGSGQPHLTNPNPQVDVPKVDAQKVEVPKVEVRVEVHNHHDRMDSTGGAGGGGGGNVQAGPRKTVGSRLGALAKGMLKGAAVLGLAAGLVVGGHYVVTDVAPKYLNQIEAPIVNPGGVDNPAIPGGQGPPVEIDPGPGVITSPRLPGSETPTLPTGETDTPPRHESPGLPGVPGGEVQLPQLTTDPLKPGTIPADGGQTLDGVLGTQPTGGPGTIQSPERGIPGLGQTDTTSGTFQGGVQIDPDKPPLIRQTLPELKPADGQVDPTTDPLKATLQGDGTPQRLDPARIQTFKPHMLRGGTPIDNNQ